MNRSKLKLEIQTQYGCLQYGKVKTIYTEMDINVWLLQNITDKFHLYNLILEKTVFGEKKNNKVRKFDVAKKITRILTVQKLQEKPIQHELNETN